MSDEFRQYYIRMIAGLILAGRRASSQPVDIESVYRNSVLDAKNLLDEIERQEATECPTRT